MLLRAKNVKDAYDGIEGLAKSIDSAVKTLGAAPEFYSTSPKLTYGTSEASSQVSESAWQGSSINVGNNTSLISQNDLIIEGSDITTEAQLTIKSETTEIGRAESVQTINTRSESDSYSTSAAEIRDVFDIDYSGFSPDEILESASNTSDSWSDIVSNRDAINDSMNDIDSELDGAIINGFSGSIDVLVSDTDYSSWSSITDIPTGIIDSFSSSEISNSYSEIKTAGSNIGNAFSDIQSTSTYASTADVVDSLFTVYDIVTPVSKSSENTDSTSIYKDSTLTAGSIVSNSTILTTSGVSVEAIDSIEFTTVNNNVSVDDNINPSVLSN